MNLLKVAFYQGANQALVDLGISKLAAKAPPITDNPYEDAPGAAAPRPVYMSDEDVPLVPSKGSRPASLPSRPSFAEDMGGSRTLSNSVSKQPAAKQPAAKQPVAKQPVAKQPAAAGRLKALYPNSPGYVAELSRQIASGSINKIPRTDGLDTRFNPRVNERLMPTPSVYPEWQGPILPPKQPKTYSSSNDLDYNMEYLRSAFTGDPLPKVVSKNPKNAPRAAAPKKPEGPVNPMTRGLTWVYDNMI